MIKIETLRTVVICVKLLVFNIYLINYTQNWIITDISYDFLSITILIVYQHIVHSSLLYIFFKYSNKFYFHKSVKVNSIYKYKCTVLLYCQTSLIG